MIMVVTRATFVCRGTARYWINDNWGQYVDALRSGLFCVYHGNKQIFAEMPADPRSKNLLVMHPVVSYAECQCLAEAVSKRPRNCYKRLGSFSGGLVTYVQKNDCHYVSHTGTTLIPWTTTIMYPHDWVTTVAYLEILKPEGLSATVKPAGILNHFPSTPPASLLKVSCQRPLWKRSSLRVRIWVSCAQAGFGGRKVADFTRKDTFLIGY